jgi:hypothetical protein
MGKVKKKTDEVKKMADLIAERRKSSHLKRSKSVRASLRFIGARFLSHKSDEVPMQKTPSMSSLHDYQRNLYEYSMLPDVFVKEPVETILKTPMVRLDQKMKLGFHRTKKDKVVSTPPPGRGAQSRTTATDPDQGELRTHQLATRWERLPQKWNGMSPSRTLRRIRIRLQTQRFL